MAAKPSSVEEVNFSKFATIVFDEFPKALRQTFISMWDRKVGALSGYQLWDDSVAVGHMFLASEGGKSDIAINRSIQEWDNAALFKATIFAKTFRLTSSMGAKKTLAEFYLRGLTPKPSPFHLTVNSPRGDQDETLTWAIDQLRLLSNTLVRGGSARITKMDFDQYVQLAKDAFIALGVSCSSIDMISVSGIPERQEAISKEAPSCNLSTITKETFVINLQEPKREVRFCQVIVMALASQESFQKALLYSDKLFTYLEASGSSTPLPYVAAEFSASDFAEYKEFTVGDGSIFSALPGLARNNGAVKKYFNGPLSSQTRYTVIQRFHSNKELLYSSDFLPPVETKGHGSFEKLKAPKGSPTNIKIVAKGSISFKISWSQPQPSHRTAIIDGYNVCIAHVQSDQDCDQIIQTKSTTIRVGVLEAATKYKVKVSARREAMFGEYSVDHFQMTKAASPTCDLSTIAEESFTIYLQAPRREVSFCQVIVIALSPNVSFSNTGYHQTYQEAIISAKPSSYIAAEFNVWEFFSYKQFTVGDGKNSTALVRMPDDIRLIKEYHNGPLFSDTTYTVFQKFYSDKELLYSSDFLPLVRTRGKSSFDKLKADSSCSSDNLKVPFVVITVLLVIILVAVVYHITHII